MPRAANLRTCCAVEWHARAFQASAGFHGTTGGGFKFFRLNLPALPSLELFDFLRTLL